MKLTEKRDIYWIDNNLTITEVWKDVHNIMINCLWACKDCWSAPCECWNNNY